MHIDGTAISTTEWVGCGMPECERESDAVPPPCRAPTNLQRLLRTSHGWVHTPARLIRVATLIRRGDVIGS